MDRLDRKTRTQILTALCEGVSQRSCQRIFRVEQNSVAKLLADAGDMAISLMSRLKDLEIRTIQADELWSYVAAKEVNVDKMKAPVEGAGTVWGYLAVCAKTKLIFHYHLGDQSLPHAEAFMSATAAKLARNSDTGEFVLRPTIITDGLPAYPQAVETAFGDYADHGIYLKKYSDVSADGKKLARKRYVGADRVVLRGEIDQADIHTSYVERQNLNVRMRNRRYGRRTNGFSKRHENHERHLALMLVYSNYCLVPRPKRQLDENGEPLLGEDGKPLPWIKRLTPAFEAGVTDRIWETEELLEATDAYVGERRRSERQAKKEAKAQLDALLAKPKPMEPARAAFWVYESNIHHTTKVHASWCSACNDGLGKGRKGNTKSGKWWPYPTLDEAVHAARSWQPDRFSICTLCSEDRSYNRSGNVSY